MTFILPFWNTIYWKNLFLSRAICHKKCHPLRNQFCVLQCQTLRTRKETKMISNQLNSCNSHPVPLQLIINNQMNLAEWLLNNNMQHSQLQYISGFCSLRCCRLCHRWLRRSFLWFFLLIRGILLFITLAKLLQNSKHPKLSVPEAPRGTGIRYTVYCSGFIAQTL